MTLTPTDQLLLSSVKIQPTSGELERMNQLIPHITNWDELAQMAIDRGMAPLLYKKLGLLSSASMIPDPAKQKLQGAYYRTLSRSMVLYDAFRKAAEAITAAGIQVVALKGIYLSEWLYKDIGLRQFSDIDLLVKKEDGEKCLEILAGLGYKESGSSVSAMIAKESGQIHYTPRVLNGVSIEIHTSLDRIKNGRQLNPELLIEKSEPVIIYNVSINTLQFYDLIIHLNIHLDKHFKEGQANFTGFIDIANLLSMHENELDWNTLKARCDDYKCEETVFKYLMLISKYFNAPVPDKIIENYAPKLTINDENLFIDYLHGYVGTSYGASTHIENFHKIEGWMKKIRYLFLVVFPTKAYMVEGYQMKNPHLYWLYYPYRHWIGLKGFAKWVFGKR